jgi:hypothetical protein
MRAAFVTAACALALPASAVAGWIPVHPTNADCGTPSPVATYGSSGRGAALGPLVLPFDDGALTAAQRFFPGEPTLVVIRGRAPRRTELTLRGYRCLSGEPLHFWYRNAPLTFSPGFPTTEEELKRRGDVAVRFPATKKLRGTYTGYMLFWDTGDWRLVLSSGRRTIGSVVVRVI